MTGRLSALRATTFNRATAPLYTPFYFRFAFDPEGVKRAGMIVQACYGIRTVISVLTEGKIPMRKPDQIDFQPLDGGDALRADGLVFERWFTEEESLSFQGTDGA